MSYATVLELAGGILLAAWGYHWVKRRWRAWRLRRSPWRALEAERQFRRRL